MQGLTRDVEQIVLTVLVFEAEHRDQEERVGECDAKQHEVMERPVAALRELCGNERGRKWAGTWRKFCGQKQACYLTPFDRRHTVDSVQDTELCCGVLLEGGNVSIRSRILQGV